MKRGLAILLTVVMMFTLGVGAAAAQEAVVVVLDASGIGISGVPVLDNQSKVYRTDRKGRAIVSVGKDTVIRVPSTYQDGNGIVHQFSRKRKAAEAGTKLLFQATSSETAQEETVLEGMYRAVRDAAKEQAPYASYWLASPMSGSERLNQMVEQAINQVRRRYPNYYLSNSTDVGYYSFDGDGRYNMLEYKLTYFLPNQERRDQVSEKIQEIMNSVSEAGPVSDYEKVKAFHDYLIDNVEYDVEASQSNSATYPNAFNAYGALIEGKAVCEGYANAFKMLCDAAGIESYVVTGTLQGPHAWNYVKLDGELYLVDCTSDDPIGGSPRWDYFLVGSGKTSAYQPDSSAPGALSEKSYPRPSNARGNGEAKTQDKSVIKKAA